MSFEPGRDWVTLRVRLLGLMEDETGGREAKKEAGGWSQKIKQYNVSTL